MPFHEGEYYPYSYDTRGAHSSAGIPSVLNSPLSQHSVPPPAMTPSSGASAVLPFKFRPRRESVDWRRINAVDIDSVVSQLDVDALQEHINTVTFCSLDGERCQRCQTPVDQTLVKLFRLAQLTVEWLLHCQEFLGINLRAAEERLAAADGERERLLAQQRKQEEKAKAMGAELKQRKKIIRTQQSMLMPGIISSQKCLHCDKSFINSAFLQNHMQRRHPDEYETQLHSKAERKSEIESLKVEIGNLKEQIDRQQQELQAKTAQEKEQRTLHKDLLREMERFKAEEMARMDRKIEDSRDGMRREMEFIYSRNIQALNEANLNQIAKYEKPLSPVHSQPERDVDNFKELQQQMKKQDKKWESRLREITAQHESEKNQLLNELNRLQSSVSDHQDRSRSLQQQLEWRLQEKEQTIEDQREQIRNISSNPPIKVVEVPVMVSAPAREPKPKRVVLEEPLCALKLDPIQELSEEEKDSCSLPEKRPLEKKPKTAPEKRQRATSSLLRNTNIMRDMRPYVEQTVIKKLESLGVEPDQSGVKKKQLTSILAEMDSRQRSFAKGKSDYLRHRKEIVSTLEQRLESLRRGSNPTPETLAVSRRSVQVSQSRPRSRSLPSRATQVMSGPADKQPKTPQPLPRTKTTTQPKTSTPTNKTAARNFLPKIPSFSSDEESEKQTDMEEDQPQTHPRGPSPPSRQNQASLTSRQRKAFPGQDRQAPVTHSFSSNRQQAAASAGGVTKTAVTKMESDEEEDDDWSDVSVLEEICLEQLQSHKDQNGNVDKKNVGVENRINDLARKVERQLAGRAVKKPAGGVSILPARKDEVQELSYTDQEESSEYMVSSLEDRREISKPAQGSGPMRSLDSASTSVWGSSSGKAPKTGLTEAGTGSTLKSSLCSLTDLSDSEDISDKL